MLFIFKKRKKRKQGIQAHIDEFREDSTLQGWAIDLAHPHQKIEVEILIDGEVAGTVWADQYRSDLQDAFGSDGRHAFSFRLDAEKMKEGGEGKVALRQAGTRKTLPCNPFMIHQGIDAEWLGEIRETRLSPPLSASSVGSQILGFLGLMKEERYKKRQKKISATQSREEGEKESCEEQIDLLTLALAKKDYANGLRQYRHLLAECTERNLHSIHQMLFDFVLEKFKSPPGEFLSTEQMRHLELFFVMLEEIDETEKLAPRSAEKKYFINFIALMIQSGMLTDVPSTRKARRWLKGSEKDLKEAIRLIEEAASIHGSIHRGDPEGIEGTLETLYRHLDRKETATPPLRALFRVGWEYFELMTNLELLDRGQIEELLHLSRNEMASMLGNSKRVALRQMEWHHLLGERWNTLVMMERLIVEGIEYVDWKSRFFPEILWLYFLEKEEKIDEKPLMDFLYKKLEEDRTVLEEDLVLMADLLHWKETARLGRVLHLTKKVIGQLYRERDSKKTAVARKLIRGLMEGTHDRFLDKAQVIGNALAEGSSPDLDLEHTSLYEEQDLFLLSLSGTTSGGLNAPRWGREFRAFLDPVPARQKAEPSSGKILVVARVRRENAGLLERYYRSLIGRIPADSMDLLGVEGTQMWGIFCDSRSVEKKEALTEASLEGYQGIWLLGDHHFVHHESFVARSEGPLLCRGEGEDDWSYYLPISWWHRYDLSSSGDRLVGADLRKVRSRLFGLVQMRYRIEGLLFEESKVAKLSFKNLEGEALDRLARFDFPIFEADEPRKALQYLQGLYEDPRVEDPISVNLEKTALIRIKSASKPMDRHDLACFLVERNEHLRLEGFFDYYRRLGVSRFYVIDNASDDGKTLDLLLDQEDVELYTTPQAYSQSLYGVKWAELLIQAKRLGRWNLVLDADELLMLDERYETLPELCNALDEEGYDALYTPFVDMYARGAIAQTPYRPAEEILEVCGYHDKHFYTFYTPYGGILGVTPTYQGGIRSRIFGLDRVVLNKLPLFRYAPHLNLREGLHWIDHARYRMGEAVLLHFKYIETFHEYVEREIARGQHWNGASEYRKYHEMLRSDPEFSLYDPTLSTPFRGVKDFFDNFSTPYHFAKEEF